MPNQIEISVQIEQPELTAQVSAPSVESSIPVLIVTDAVGNVTIIGFNEVFNQVAESGDTVNLPAAVIELEGGTNINLDPGQSYEVLKARVLNPNGTLLLKLGPDEFYQLQNSTVTGANGNYSETIEPGQSLDLPNSRVLLEGGTIITKLDPGEDWTVLKARILNPNGTLLLKLGPDEFYQLQNSQLNDSAGNPLLTIAPGATAIAPDGLITNSENTNLGTVRSGQLRILSDISLTQVNGSVSAIPALKNATCQWYSITIRNSQGINVSSISSYPAGGIHTLPELRSGIAYSRIVPTQYTSYTPGDIGWCIQNGRYDWADIDYPLYTQRLDLTSAAEWFYQLRFNNAFGNKFRFTNAAGVQAPDGRLNFASGTYIIDHLTGFAFWSDSIGAQSSFAAAMIAARDSTQSGFTDWMPLTREIFQSAIIANTTFINTQSPFKVAASQNMWFGETVENSTANAWRLTTGGQSTSVGAKTLSGIHMFICRIHYK